MQPASQSADLRKRLLVRIVIAVLALVAVVVGVQSLERSATPRPADTAAVGPTPPAGSAQPQSAAAPVAQGSVAAAGTIQTEPAPATAAREQDTQPVDAATPALASAAPAAVQEPKHTETAVPFENKTAAASTPAQPAPLAMTSIPRGPHLQAGVFLQAANAEALRAKLAARGIPVYIESRVQVGPFKDRREAERVRDELKAAGLTTLLIVQ